MFTSLTCKSVNKEWRLPIEPKPKKSCQSRSKVKVMLIVFFDYRGVVHSEFLPEGQTVNKEYYLGVMRESKFVEKGQVCGKKTHGFCTISQGYHCERISRQKLNKYHRATTIFT